MTQVEMIKAQKTVEDTEAMLNDICTFRLSGRCNQYIKDYCFDKVMRSACHKCKMYRIAEDHKRSLINR